MKKIVNSVIAIAAVLGMVSCAKELNEAPEKAAPKQLVSVFGTIEQTKVAYTDGGTSINAAWEVNDKVFGLSQAGAVTYKVASVTAGKATFEYVDGTEPAEGNTLILVYAPNNSTANINAQQEIPLYFENQNANLSGIKNKTYMCAQGVVADGSVELIFSQKTALLEIKSVTGLPSSNSPVLLSVAGSNFKRQGKIGMTAHGVDFIPVDGGYLNVTTINKTGTNYIVVPPTTAPTSLEFTFEQDANKYVATLSGTKQIEAGHCYTINALNFSQVASPADIALQNSGKNVDDYVKLNLGYTWNSWYNCTDGTNHSKINTGSTTLSGANMSYFSTYCFSQNQIPVGSVIVLLDTYRYRPEGWANFGTKQSARGDEVKASGAANIKVVDAAWWSGKAYRGFNVAKAAGYAQSASDQARITNSFAIYVPKSALVPATPDTSALDDLLSASGKNPSDYNKIVPEMLMYSYWYSSDGTNYNKPLGTTTTRAFNSNLIQFACTKDRFTPTDIPVGSVIVVKTGFQYRPDGWIANAKLASGRPGAVTTNVVVVDAAWWQHSSGSNFILRGFNIQTNPAANMTYAQMQEAASSAFAIYVPKN